MYARTQQVLNVYFLDKFKFSTGPLLTMSQKFVQIELNSYAYIA